MNRIKTIFAVLAALTLILSLAACGTDSQKEITNTMLATESQKETAESTKAAESQTASAETPSAAARIFTAEIRLFINPAWNVKF